MPACYGSSLGSNPDISQKHKICDISKGVANTFYPANKIYRKMYEEYSRPALAMVRKLEGKGTPILLGNRDSSSSWS
jgi:hypothetical protein